jgi:ribonuclease Z
LDCILLGSGGMMPMPYRLLTSLAVRLMGRIYLFDAGEGVQLNWKRAHLGVRGLRLIAVTHLHADHCLGLPGLMMLKAQMEDPVPLTILGPPGIEEFVEKNREMLQFFINYPVRFVVWTRESPEPAYEDELARVFWHPMKHTRFCLGYRIEELERPGKFDPKRAEALGIPGGPLWGKLQRGEKIVDEGGREIRPDQVLGPPRPGRAIAFIVDTRPTKGIHRLCKNANLAFIEGMFLPEDSRHADAKGHLTVVEAAGLAERAGCERAVLVHLSPRYLDEHLDLIERTARERFGRLMVGRDLEVYPVRFPRAEATD